MYVFNKTILKTILKTKLFRLYNNNFLIKHFNSKKIKNFIVRKYF